MSVVVQVGGIDPEGFWRAGALPLAVVLDLALGDVPGRTAAVRGLDRLVVAIEGRIGRLVGRLGGGRGGDLFGGLLATFLVAGTAAGLAWLAVDRADAAGGPISLAVRTLLIAAGLSIRVTGDALLQAIEAPDPGTAARWLESATGRPVGTLSPAAVDEAVVARTGSSISGMIVAPLAWLAVGGPAAFWGFLALRQAGQAMSDRARPGDFRARVPRDAARLAEWPGSLLGVALIVLVAAPLRLRPLGAGVAAARTGRDRPGDPAAWTQGALAGALGVRIRGGRSSGDPGGDPGPSLGGPGPAPDAATAATGVRVLQLVALAAAGIALLVGLARA